MNQDELRRDWLPTIRRVPQEKFPRKPYIKSFFHQARSRWLDIGLVPFLRAYGPRLCLGP